MRVGEVMGILFTNMLTVAMLSYNRRGGKCALGKRVSSIGSKVICLGGCRSGSFVTISSTIVASNAFGFRNIYARPLTCKLAAFESDGHPLMFFLSGRGVRLGVGRSRGVLAIANSTVGSLCTRGTPLAHRSKCDVSDLITIRPTSTIAPCFVIGSFTCGLGLRRVGTLHTGLSTSLSRAVCIDRVSNFVGQVRSVRINTITPSFALPSMSNGPIALSNLEKGCMLVSF